MTLGEFIYQFFAYTDQVYLDDSCQYHNIMDGTHIHSKRRLNIYAIDETLQKFYGEYPHI